MDFLCQNARDYAVLANKGGLTSLTEAEVLAAKYGVNFAEIIKIHVFIEEFHRLKGVVVATDKALIKQINAALKRVSAQLDKTCIKHLTKKYAQRQVGDTTVYASIDHWCNAELKLKYVSEAQGMVLDISGGHLHGAYEAVERAGFIKITKIDTLPSGAMQYYMKDVFTGRTLTKTVFPKSWDVRKLCDVAWELYEGVGAVAPAESGGFLKQGIIDGVNMEIYYTSKNDGLRIEKIITSYPVSLKKV